MLNFQRKYKNKDSFTDVPYHLSGVARLRQRVPVCNNRCVIIHEQQGQ